MSQAQLMEIKLSRFDAQPWGFRLQGGVDFAMPLIVQKVNGGSLAEQAGLMPGDAVIKINDVDVYSMRHKEAQDVVVRSGNNFVMTVQRGGSTWRPHVVPTGQLPKPNSPYLQTVTKTSLAHKQPPVQHIGCGYNSSARPFANCTGGDGSVKSIVNKQYNSPVGIYSDEAIAETLSAQAEILAGGVLGVNFKKNEKEYQPDKSEVLKLLREEESGGQSSPAFNSYQELSNTISPQQQQQQQQSASSSPLQQQQQQQQQQQLSSSSSVTRHVTAPVSSPKPSNTGGLPTGQNICYECERLITGVFVRIKDKNLHVECFKCATCGTSLKNQGYYNFNNKLYCDIHAKLAALQSPPSGTEGYVPVPIKPNTKLSASSISSALNAHGYNGLSNGSSAGGNSMPMTTPINQGYVRPFGAATSGRSQVPAAAAATAPSSSSPFSTMAPKSPVIFPPQTSSNTPTSYATLPRSNFSQQYQQQQQGRKVQSMYLNNYQQQLQQQQQQQQQQCNNNYKPTTLYQRNRTVGPNRYTTIPITYNKTMSSNSFNHNKNNYNFNKGLTTTTTANYKQMQASATATATAAVTASQQLGALTSAANLPFNPIQMNLDSNVGSGSTGGGILPPKGGVFGATTAPKRGRGIMNKAVSPGARIPLCNSCNTQIRGPFITALGRIWCPEHFICVNANCRRPLQDIGFVEEKGDLYCEYCFEKYLAPTCNKCANKIKGDCLNAIGKHFHPECFSCAHCGKLFGNTPFFLEDGEPYCEADWNELFTTKCYACGFPVEAGDRWVEALNHNYHSQCFNCTFCKQNLEGQSFYNKGGRPFCKNHAR